jgi:hypothetical protein
VDLTALIYVAVAAAWLVYLIPVALKRSDELSSRRPVEEFSDSVRVLRRTPGAPVSQSPTQQPATPKPQATRTRAAAKAAARRRRRVLYTLLLATAITAGVAGYGQIPWWSLAIPGGLIVVFLVIARLTVRRENARYASSTSVATEVAEEDEEAAAIAADEELTEEIDLRKVPASIGLDALAEEGALWDPLPLTLPTYVGKAHARRTVRTIDLTGMNSSGHDEADSKLAREADEARKAERAEEATGEAERKVAGA